MSRRERGLSAHGGRLAAFAGAAVAISLVVSPGVAIANTTDGPPPMTSAITTASNAWLAIPMGQYAIASDTFWELFVRQPSSDRWSLVTPPGVADNGGLAVAPAGATGAVVGVLPTDKLTFSPFSVTTNAGRTYTNDLDPEGLPTVPESLAETHGRTVVIAHDRRSLLVSGSSAEKWPTLLSATSASNESSGRHCSVTAFSAVATVGALTVAAAECAQTGTVEIVDAMSGVPIGGRIPLPSSWSSTPVAVLRLTSSSGGMTALIEGGTLPSHQFTVVSYARATWSTSRPVTLPRGSMLRATAVGMTGEVGLLGSDQSGGTFADLESGGAWRELMALPSGVVALSIAPGEVDLFTVQSSTLRVYEDRGSHYTLEESIDVPIDYGSSG